MTTSHLGAAVRAAIADWEKEGSAAKRLEELAEPAQLAEKLHKLAIERLPEGGAELGTIRALVSSEPCLHLKGIISLGQMQSTPGGFTPVPDDDTTIRARATVLAIHSLLGMETISYGTENNGELFVNLVPIDGQGAYAEKSKNAMRGHTDAASFPFSGERDHDQPRIAPSPDLVTLIGLRNPSKVPTTIMPLKKVVSGLDQQTIEVLQEPRFSIRPQKTFIEGMQKKLGRVHVLHRVPLLRILRTSLLSIRYSHSSVVSYDSADSVSEEACNRLQQACAHSVEELVIEPGDILVINNRSCLHGRRSLGEEGNNGRWLIRAYGLNTETLSEEQRYHDGDPKKKHILYP
ncbi:MAG: TauD/TfdA family dioxygenase [Alcanivoracaceae bacterium]|nr:TauD/TfdA family dioxygenase [Alcanivoracaceae bacterium]